ncbi:MAG: MarR family transcriptional regulator [Rhizobiaceae bacterium]|nr:MarR family transcriptional regulator [Rhizobiaceae bacterium]
MTKTDSTSLSIWLQIAKASAHLEQEINGKLRENYNQSLTRFDVLSQFIRAGCDEMSVGTLSSELIASSGNISRLLDRMEKDGQIIRRHSASDRRSVYVDITQAGRELFAAMAADHREWINQTFQELPADQQSQLDELLKELLSVLKKRR